MKGVLVLLFILYFWVSFSYIRELSFVGILIVEKLLFLVTNVVFYHNRRYKKVFFDPPEGTVLISCTDDKGRNSSIKIKVKKVDL